MNAFERRKNVSDVKGSEVEIIPDLLFRVLIGISLYWARIGFRDLIKELVTLTGAINA
jgi:hypothetical protein